MFTFPYAFFFSFFIWDKFYFNEIQHIRWLENIHYDAAHHHSGVSSHNGSVAEQMCQRYTEQACKISRRGILKDNSLKNARIIGGIEALPKQYPYMALIGRYSKRTKALRWFCGGSLISENFVLTAAHCVHKVHTWIRLGELDYTSDTDGAKPFDFKVEKKFVHPDYHRTPNKSSSFNDIGLFKFQGVPTFSDYIRPICLNVIENFPEQKLFAAGWGRTSYQSKGSSKLLHVDLDLQSNEKCSGLYRNFNHTVMICAGYAPGGKGTCKGDSGGPLLISKDQDNCSKRTIHTQVGIMSGGKGCGWMEVPKKFTRVSYYIPWIESIVWKTT